MQNKTRAPPGTRRVGNQTSLMGSNFSSAFLFALSFFFAIKSSYPLGVIFYWVLFQSSSSPGPSHTMHPPWVILFRPMASTATWLQPTLHLDPAPSLWASVFSVACQPPTSIWMFPRLLKLNLCKHVPPEFPCLSTWPYLHPASRYWYLSAQTLPSRLIPWHIQSSWTVVDSLHCVSRICRLGRALLISGLARNLACCSIQACPSHWYQRDLSFFIF